MDYNIKNIKITKVNKLLEINNEICHNFYFIVYARAYVDDKRYQKARFVVWFDTFDIMEYFETDYYDAELIKEYRDELIFSFIYQFNTTRDLVDGCNTTLKIYYNIGRNEG